MPKRYPKALYIQWSSMNVQINIERTTEKKKQNVNIITINTSVHIINKTKHKPRSHSL